MAAALLLDSTPALRRATMLLAFDGWMDGGDVSTGTVGMLMQHLSAVPFGRIHSHEYYIESFPGDMAVTALFRPHVEIVAGRIERFDPPANEFFVAEDANLILFRGREPNLRWDSFADHLFEVAARTGVERMIFIGSFAGAVPHTREPRLYVTVSSESLREEFERFGCRLSNYEGPASFANYLLSEAPQRGIEMASLVAEIPAYIQGTNPMSIEAVTRRLAAILGLGVDLDALRVESDEWESRVTARAQEEEELAEQIRQLEKQYDDELLDSAAEAD